MDNWTPLRVIARISKPVITTGHDLKAYVFATTLLCLSIALSADITNQLIFFEGWDVALRSWAITCVIVIVIATPVSFSIGRTALELNAAKHTIAQQLQALTQAHEATEAAYALAESMARHDILTGLPNRRMFMEALAGLADRARGTTGPYAVLNIDLDQFKPVNDLYGHAAGDELLCEIAGRLREAVGKRDIVARFGGDEFSALVKLKPNSDLDTQAAQVAIRLMSKFEQPVDIGGRSVNIGASIGVALYPQNGMEAETLLKAADVAMYRAKQDGRGKYQIFTQDLESDLRSTAKLEAEVRDAVLNGRIVAYYQPLVRLSNQELVGFEILARWPRDGAEEIGPAVFIPAVERLGLIGQLTYALLRQACVDASDWPSDISIAINMSAHHLKDPMLPMKFLSILTETSFAPSRLEVEVTETALIEDMAAAKTSLQMLRAVGIKIALDDFGTGYANLQYLRELPFDKIKIDQSFVKGMTLDAHQTHIVRSVLELARSLGVPAIAEGVEDEKVNETLKSMGAEYGQGFCFGKAVSSEDAGQIVSKGLSLSKRGFG